MDIFTISYLRHITNILIKLIFLFEKNRSSESYPSLMKLNQCSIYIGNLTFIIRSKIIKLSENNFLLSGHWMRNREDLDYLVDDQYSYWDADNQVNYLINLAKSSNQLTEDEFLEQLKSAHWSLSLALLGR